MDPARWQEIQELFDAALDCPEERRAAFLGQRCGNDTGLLEEVEALLRAESGSDSFLGRRIGRGYHLLDKSLDTATYPPTASGSLARAGKYEIFHEIGHGGGGTVFAGRDPDLQRTVAIKTCTSREPDQRRRFFREGRIAASLRHTNITRIYDVGFEGRLPYLVQEYLPGRDLSELIAEGSLSTSVKLDLLARIASGLAYAHEQGVLHRDIKPSNIRVLDDGTPKILDFGIARLLHGDETRLTRTGTMLGTVGYLAPEQLEGGRVDQRADVFGFGVLAYELLSGRRPFVGETFGMVSFRLLHSDPEPLHVAWPSCPDRRLSKIVGRCLEKAAASRWPSIDEVAAALHEVAAALHEVAAALHEVGEKSVPTLPSRGVGGRFGGVVTVGLLVVVAVMGLGVHFSETGADVEPLVESPMRFASVSAVPAGWEPPRPEEAQTDGSRRNGSEGTSESRSQENQPSELEVAVVQGEATEAEDEDSESEGEDAEAEHEATEPADAQPADDSDTVVEVTQAPAAGSESYQVESSAPPAVMRLGEAITAPGPGVVPPKMLEFVKPAYPKRARRRRQEARVIVAVYVDETGKVVDTLLKQKAGSDLGFDEAAVEAALRTRFEPATRDGIAGRMWTEIPYDFTVRR